MNKTIEMTVEQIRRNLVTLVPEFSFRIGGTEVTVIQNFEDGETNDDVGAIYATCDTTKVYVYYYPIPADRMSDYMYKCLAARIYCRGFLAKEGKDENEALLDAMVLVYARATWNLNVYPVTAARWYQKAYGIQTAPGCEGPMHDMAMTYIRQRQAAAMNIVKSLSRTNIFEDLGKAIPEASNDSKLQAVMMIIMTMAA